MADDIRVKLSPAGLQDVVAALRTVRAEAELAARSSSASFSGLSPVLLNIRSLLGTLGIATTAAALVGFVKTAGEFADEMGKAAQRIGATSAEFSVLTFAAKTANVEAGTLETGIQKLVVSIADLRKGNLAAVDAFDELGLSAADFAGKNGAQSFDLIASKLVKLTDETKKVEVARAIFGRGGAQLLVLLNDLGTKGFAKVREEAEKMGLVIGSDLADASQNANDALTLVGQQAKGLAVQFLSGLAPAVTRALTSFQDDTAGTGVDSMNKFGEVIGKVIGGAVNGFRVLGDVVGLVFGGLGKGIAAIAASFTLLFQGDFVGAGRIIKDFASDFNEGLEKLGRDTEKFFTDVFKSPPPIEPKVRPQIDDAETEKASESIRAQIENKLADIGKKLGIDELKNLDELTKKRAQIGEEEIKNAEAVAAARAAVGRNVLQSERLINAATDTALKQRLALAKSGFDSEISLSKAKAAALSNANDVKNPASRARIETEIAKRANAEQLASAQNYYSKLIGLNTDWLNRYKAASDQIRNLDRERAQLRTDLAKTLQDIDDQNLTEEELFSARRRQAVELEARQRAAIAAGDIENARELTKELLAAGAELAKLGAPRTGRSFAEDAAAGLDALLQKQKAAAAAEKALAGENIQSIGQQINTLQTEIAELRSKGFDLKFQVDQGAFRTLLSSIQDQLSQQNFRINVTANTTGGAGGFARGGLLPGPASLTGPDNMLAWVKSGEFVMSTPAVHRYGAEFFDALNRMQLPRFADGGLVSGGAGAGDVQHLELSFNRRPIGRVTGSRDTVRALVEALTEVSRATI